MRKCCAQDVLQTLHATPEVLLFFQQIRENSQEVEFSFINLIKYLSLIIIFVFHSRIFFSLVTVLLSNRAKFSQSSLVKTQLVYIIRLCYFFRAVFWVFSFFSFTLIMIESSKEKCWFSLILLHIFSGFFFSIVM